MCVCWGGKCACVGWEGGGGTCPTRPTSTHTHPPTRTRVLRCWVARRGWGSWATSLVTQSGSTFPGAPPPCARPAGAGGEAWLGLALWRAHAAPPPFPSQLPPCPPPPPPRPPPSLSEGNNWSYQYCRRQWSLVDSDHLRYRHARACGLCVLRERVRLFVCAGEGGREGEGSAPACGCDRGGGRERVGRERVRTTRQTHAPARALYSHPARARPPPPPPAGLPAGS